MSRLRAILPKLAPFAVLAYVLYLFAAAQGLSHGVYDREGYFNARFAQMMPGHFLERSFPWTQASIWKDHFCDKEFLFHVLLVPFTRNVAEPIAGAQLCSLLLIAGVFAGVYLVLRLNRAPLPWLFALAMLSMGADFLVRIEAIRAHVLSIILAIVGVQLLCARRWRWLIALGFLYSWSYSFPFILLFICIPFVFGRWLAGDGLDWKSVAGAFVGIVLGLAIHPYSPHTFDTFVVIARELLVSARSDLTLALGGEMASPSGRELLLNHPVFAAGLAALLIAGWRLGRRASGELLGMLATIAFWSAMSAMIARSIEYAVPLLAITLGLAARDILAGLNFEEQLVKLYPRQTAAGFALAVLLLAGGHVQSTMGWYATKELAHPPHFRLALKWLAAHTEPGETVVNLWWHDFPDLYYDGVRQTYVWGMDPHFTVLYDADAAAMLEKMRSGKMTVDGPLLARTFHARYMVLQNWSEEMDLKGLRLGEWKPVYADRYALVFALSTPPKAADAKPTTP